MKTPGSAIPLRNMRNEQSEPSGESRHRAIQFPPFETAIFDIVPDAMVVTDKTGAILFVNSQTETMFGYSRVELLEMKLEVLLPEQFRKSHEERRDAFFADPKLRPMGAHLELFGMRKEGAIFPVEISLNSFQDNDRTLAIATVRDVSDRRHLMKKLEAKIKDLADFKSAMDEHSILAITDPKGRITYANDKFCAISKYSREELVGEDHRIINSRYHPKEFWREAWTTIAGGKVWRGRVRNRAKDGSYYWVDATIVPFHDEDGKPLQYLAIRTEITAQVKAEEEREALILELRNALAEVKTLSGLLPICCRCKKVRDDKGYWAQIEAYVTEHSGASFSHGYCPDCLPEAYKEAGLPVPDEYIGNPPG